MTIDMESVIPGDRRIVLFSLFAAATLAWLYLALLAQGTGDGMTPSRATTWTPVDIVLMFIMWAVMMLGMMLRSASPMTLMFVRGARPMPGK